MTTQENMLARYKILHELGRGATGAVYAARDRETGGVVALKRVDPASLGKPDASFAERFVKQARAARLLRHRNIVTIHDAGEVGGTVYIAMELLEGESLGKILAGAPLPIVRAIQIVRDIAGGLAHAHLEGVVHGGLKPSNIIISRSGVVTVTDFGIGQLAHAALLAGAPDASLSYLSPEQLRGDPVDHRSDVFSLGVLFYEMLAHRAPFAGGSREEIMENILHAKPPLPSELNPHVPRALDAIVSSMLAGQPAARMPGVPILLRDLQGLEEGLGLGSKPRASAGEAPATPPPAEREPRPQAPAPDRPGIRNARHRAPEGATRAASAVRPFAGSSPAEPLEPRDRTTDNEAFDYQKAIALMERESRRERTSGPRRPVFAALAVVLAVIGIGFGAFTYYSTAGSSDRGIVASARDTALEWLAERSRHARADRAETARAAPSPSAPEAPATTQMVSRAVAPAPVVDATPGSAPVPAAKPTPPKALPPEPGVLAKNDSSTARAPEEPAKRGIGEEAPAAAPAPSRPPAAAPVAEATQQPAAAPAAPDASPPLAADDGKEAQLSSVSSAADPTPPEPAAQAPLPLTYTTNPRAPAPEQAASARTAPARTLPRAKQPTPEVQQQQRAATARVILSVSPRGEIYIDGKHHGTTPPITTLDLEPGMHRIEVRSGSSTPYLTYVTLQMGDVRHIRYDFDVSRAVYPGKRASWQKSERAAR